MAKPGTTFHFTAEGVKALKPAATRVEYWDARLTGFGLRVTPRGAKTWFYWYRQGHVKRRQRRLPPWSSFTNTLLRCFTTFHGCADAGFLEYVA